MTDTMDNYNRRLNLYDVIESLRPNQLKFSFGDHVALTHEAYEAGLISSDDKKFLLSINQRMCKQMQVGDKFRVNKTIATIEQFSKTDRRFALCAVTTLEGEDLCKVVLNVEKVTERDKL